MPVFDKDEQRVVVRIVYDGPAKAGKTTNLRRLCEHFGVGNVAVGLEGFRSSRSSAMLALLETPSLASHTTS